MAAPTLTSDRDFAGLLAAAAASDPGEKLSATTTVAAASRMSVNFIFAPAVGDNQNDGLVVEILPLLLRSASGCGQCGSVGRPREICLL